MRLHPKVMRALQTPWPFIVLWWLGGLLSIFVPLSKWNSAKNDYYLAYGRYNEYEQQQRQYQEGQNYNYNQQAFNCKWWQYKCRQQMYSYMQNVNNNGDGMTFYTPGWYQFLGGRIDQDSRDREMLGLSVDENSGAIKFVYGWSIVIFLSVLAYGTYVFYKRRTVMGLNGLLAINMQYALLMIVVVPQGVIGGMDERSLEESAYGWYGQMGVLLVYFFYAQLLFGVVFLVLNSLKAGFDRFLGTVEVEKVVEEEQDPIGEYHAHGRPLMLPKNEKSAAV